MDLSSTGGRDFGTILIMIGFVYLLHLPTTELRRPVNLSFWKEVSEMNSTEEFIQKYVHKGAAEDQSVRMIDMLRHSNGGHEMIQGFENMQQELPTSLIQPSMIFPCYPLNTSVPVPIDPDPSYERLPQCVILPQCGGCCGPVTTCLPTSVVPVTVTVHRGIPEPDAVFTPVNVTMEIHTECACSCAILAGDCNPETQVYSSELCSCHCRNADDATNCSSQRIWNEKECRCLCRNITNCLDDEVFNFTTCSCERKR